MFKIIGLLLLCISVASVGFINAQRLKKQKNLFEQLTHFSKIAVNEMRGLNSSIFEIFKNNSSDELNFLKDITAENIKNRNEVLKIMSKTKADKESIELMADFIINFGVSDIKGQIAHCEYYSIKFEIKCKTAELQFSEKGKLGITLSCLLASALFIILI